MEELYESYMGINIYKVYPFDGSEEYHFKALGIHFDTEAEAYESIEEYMGLPEH